MILPVGQINLRKPEAKRNCKPLPQKYSPSAFRKIMFFSPRPASMKRGERVVTIVRRDAMDANALSDVQCASGRQKRVGLAP
jgi:hypothetical protein